MSDAITKEITKKGASNDEFSVPEACFIPDVEVFLKKYGQDQAMGTLKELLSKFNFMSENLTFQKRNLLRKIPDIQQSLESVQFIKRKSAEGDSYVTQFPLTDNVHAKAELKPTSTVFLWLGANVMLEYSVDEAEALLVDSQQSAQTSLANIDKSLAFLREQITTTEVNIARSHNYTVRARQRAAAVEA